ncbi:MAG TPA: MlaD family protein [Rhodothermales bacterium]|nr:MlaD family protein [Rhodothermales bacterium]
MRFSNELKVGIAIIAAAVIFILGVRFFADLPLFRGTYPLQTEMADASGLTKGAAVEVRGVRVGAVDKVDLSQQSNGVLIQFHIDNGIVVPTGSHTEIAGFSALGQVRLEIVPGSGETPVEPGGFIPSQQSNALGELQEKAPELLERVDTLLIGANRFFDQAEPAINQVQSAFNQAETSFEQIGNAANQVGGNANQTVAILNDLLRNPNGDIRMTLANLRTATEQANGILHSQQARIEGILTDLQRFSTVAGNFAETNQDSIGVAVNNLNATLRRLNRNLASLESTSTSLDSIMARIDRGEGTAGLLINDPRLYQNMVSLTENLNALVLDVQKNPKRYLKNLSLVDVF